MLNNYLIFLPESGGNVEEEWRQCLQKISATSLPGNRLVKLNIFVDSSDYQDYLKVSTDIRKSVTDYFGDQCPAFNVTVHPPEKPLKVIVEAGYMSTENSEFISKVWNSIHYIVTTSDSGKEVWAGGLGYGLFPADTRLAANAAFDQMRGLLSAEGMSFNNLVRQWNYIGNILEVKDENQNYQIFNGVRSENYHKYRTIHGYPAATGVGMKFGGVMLDFYAVKAVGSTKIIAIDNPDQIRPYEYGQQVMKGVQRPQFERAVLITDNRNSTLYISGTASIIGQDTVGIDNVEQQTFVTIDNISKLTEVTRIGHLTGNPDSFPGRMFLLRVYIKREEDFAKVKAICNKLYPSVPSLFIEADICRGNLLVEIEAESSKNSLTGATPIIL
jgi:hypothetical protein